MNAAGLALLKRHEKCKLVAYKDPHGTWTIGWGHTRGVTAGMTCTQAQADAWLAEDVAIACGDVTHWIHSPAPANDNQLSAMESLAYNIGGPAFRTSSVLRLVNHGLWAEAADAFRLFDKMHVDGQLIVSEELERRREDERALFLTPIAEAS